MDVTPYGQVPPHELDIGGPDVVFQDGFANFLEVEMASLRDRFVPQNHFDRDAYEDLFDASKDLVRSTLEQIWSERFEWNDIKKDVLQVEKRKLETGLKLDNLEAELDNLPWWRDAIDFDKPDRVLEDIRKLLNALDNDLYQVRVVKWKIHNLFNTATYKNSRKLEQLEKNILGEEHSISGDLQLLLVRRQREAIQADAIEFEAFNKFFTEKAEAIQGFISEWRFWHNRVGCRNCVRYWIIICVMILLMVVQIIIVLRRRRMH